MGFPDKVFTGNELKAAKALVDQGYKHSLIVEGEPEFIKKVQEALEFIKTAGYADYLHTYIRKIVEIDGMTQLRQSEAAIWANKFAVENPVDAAVLSKKHTTCRSTWKVNCIMVVSQRNAQSPNASSSWRRLKKKAKIQT